MKSFVWRGSIVAVAAALSLTLAGCLVQWPIVPSPPPPALIWTEFTIAYPMAHPADPPPDHIPASSSDPNISGIDLTRGPGVQPGSLVSGFSAIEWKRDNPSLEDSIEAELYFQFGLTVPNGVIASLSTLDMKLRRAAGPSPRDMVVLVSLDEFATEGTEVSSFSYHGRSTGDPLDPDPTVDDPFYYMHSDLPARTAGDPIPTIDLTGIPLLQRVTSRQGV